MEESENKIPVTITLVPVARAWARGKARELDAQGVRQDNGRPPSASWVIETLVIDAMKKDAKKQLQKV